jgi:hypothetical protein
MKITVGNWYIHIKRISWFPSIVKVVKLTPTHVKVLTPYGRYCVWQLKRFREGFNKRVSECKALSLIWDHAYKSGINQMKVYGKE